MRTAIWIVAFSLMWISVTLAQSLDGAYYQMYKFFDVAEDRPDLDQKLVGSLRLQVRSIQEITSRFPKDAIPPDYVQALTFNAKLLNAAIRPNATAEDAKNLQSVRDDLELKIRYESTVSGAKDTFRGRVRVSVKTKAGSADRSGLVISANPRRWQDAAPMFPLGLSSPARGAMPPGIYQFIAQSADGKLIAKQDFSIGLNGQDIEDVEMAVPSPP